jgi:hypothetical protein
MTNLTISIDEKVLQDARIRALKQGTSVNLLLREYLEAYAAQEETHLRLRKFLEIAKNSKAASRSGERAWKRSDLYVFILFVILVFIGFSPVGAWQEKGIQLFNGENLSGWTHYLWNRELRKQDTVTPMAAVWGVKE